MKLNSFRLTCELCNYQFKGKYSGFKCNKCKIKVCANCISRDIIAMGLINFWRYSNNIQYLNIRNLIFKYVNISDKWDEYLQIIDENFNFILIKSKKEERSLLTDIINTMICVFNFLIPSKVTKKNEDFLRRGSVIKQRYWQPKRCRAVTAYATIAAKCASLIMETFDKNVIPNGNMTMSEVQLIVEFEFTTTFVPFLKKYCTYCLDASWPEDKLHKVKCALGECHHCSEHTC